MSPECAIWMVDMSGNIDTAWILPLYRISVVFKTLTPVGFYLETMLERHTIPILLSPRVLSWTDTVGLQSYSRNGCPKSTRQRFYLQVREILPRAETRHMFDIISALDRSGARTSVRPSCVLLARYDENVGRLGTGRRGAEEPPRTGPVERFWRRRVTSDLVDGWNS